MQKSTDLQTQCEKREVCPTSEQRSRGIERMGGMTLHDRAAGREQAGRIILRISHARNRARMHAYTHSYTYVHAHSAQTGSYGTCWKRLGLLVRPLNPPWPPNSVRCELSLFGPNVDVRECMHANVQACPSGYLGVLRVKFYVCMRADRDKSARTFAASHSCHSKSNRGVSMRRWTRSSRSLNTASLRRCRHTAQKTDRCPSGARGASHQRHHQWIPVLCTRRGRWAGGRRPRRYRRGT